MAKKKQAQGKTGKGAKSFGKKTGFGATGKHNPPTPGGKIGKPKFAKGGLAKSLRGVDRFLTRPDLDPAIRRGQEQKRELLLAQIAEQKQLMQERKMAVRYHKIRFFERQKMERRVTQLGRTAAMAAKAHAPLPDNFAENLAQARADLRYVTHFPKGEKYVSLVMEAATPEAQSHLQRERARLRELVARAAEEEALLGEGDEGRGLQGKKQEVKEGKSRERKAAAAQAAAAAEAGGGGDDFFLLEGEPEGKKEGKGAKRQRIEKGGLSSEEEGEKGSGGSDGGSDEEEECDEEAVAAAKPGAAGGSNSKPPAPGTGLGETEQERKVRHKADRKARARQDKRLRVAKRAAARAAGTLVSGKKAKKAEKEKSK